MPERSEKALRLLCWGLGAVLLLQVVFKIVARNPLSGLKIPALPALKEAAESSTGGKGPGTNASHTAGAQATSKSTNAPALAAAGGKETNQLSQAAGSNQLEGVSTNGHETRPTPLLAQTHPAGGESNSAPAQAVAEAGTNSTSPGPQPQSGTNVVAGRGPGANGTNVLAEHKGEVKGPYALAMAGPHGPMHAGGPGKPAPDLPLPIQAEVDRVVDSELFGPVFHPMPAGLLGIAGNVAFLRAANGQSGMVKEGDELGGLKLLRIGINRVLVEEDGQKKELMIFEGLGGHSLLPN